MFRFESFSTKTFSFINHLFSIDVQTHALKSINPLPVSRKEYITCKLATLLVWMLILALITIVVSGRYLYGTVILFLVMIIIAFFVEFTRNGSISLIIATLLGFLNLTGITLQNEALQYIPWLLPSK